MFFLRLIQLVTSLVIATHHYAFIGHSDWTIQQFLDFYIQSIDPQVNIVFILAFPMSILILN